MTNGVNRATLYSYADFYRKYLYIVADFYGEYPRLIAVFYGEYRKFANIITAIISFFAFQLHF